MRGGQCPHLLPEVLFFKHFMVSIWATNYYMFSDVDAQFSIASCADGQIMGRSRVEQHHCPSDVVDAVHAARQAAHYVLDTTLSTPMHGSQWFYLCAYRCTISSVPSRTRSLVHICPRRERTVADYSLLPLTCTLYNRSTGSWVAVDSIALAYARFVRGLPPLGEAWSACNEAS